jgi:hypothetical protein
MQIKITAATRDVSTNIGDSWIWTALPVVDGKAPSRLIILWGHIHINGITYSARFTVYNLFMNYNGIFLAPKTRVLAIY